MNPKRLLIVSITFLGGLYFFLEFMLPEKIGGFQFGKYHEQIMLGVRIVGSMAFGLGIINIVRVHGARIIRAQKGWENSLALLLGFLLMLGVDGLKFAASVNRAHSVEELEHLRDFVQVIEEERLADKLVLTADATVPAEYRVKTILAVIERHRSSWNTALTAAAATLPPVHQEKAAQLKKALEEGSEIATRLSEGYSLLRHKKAVENLDPVEKALMTKLKEAAQLERELGDVLSERELVSRLSHLLYDGFFVSLGSAMFSLLAFYIAGAAYRAFRVRSVEASVLMITATLTILGQIPQGRSISERLPQIRLWLLENVNTPGNRAIYFGSAIAGLAMAVRMWLSLEKSPLESSSEEGS